MKKILIKYTIRSGEYEFNGHTVLNIQPRQKVETQVHNYLMDFYGNNTCKKDCERLNSYLYNGGEVAVDHISFKEISESDAEVLTRLNV
ncbi:MAG: hypothetical protein IMZ61_11565 [Planctomycetes bacterium]|nr:hypothetical protein [Planctomycetota bacterium]